MPGNWAEPVGLAAEILPLDKPYANWTGGIFRGIVPFLMADFAHLALLIAFPALALWLPTVLG